MLRAGLDAAPFLYGLMMFATELRGIWIRKSTKGLFEGNEAGRSANSQFDFWTVWPLSAGPSFMAGAIFLWTNPKLACLFVGWPLVMLFVASTFKLDR